jgi:DNA polymerase/3'-5' exonuclease PolX
MNKLIPVNKDEVERGFKPKYRLEDVWPIAQEVVGQLRPHCERAEIVGSVRRGKEHPSDLELLLLPSAYDIGLLKHGLPEVVDQWEIIKGKLIPGKTKYTQRMHPSGIKLDLFLANETNFGYLQALRTGPVKYNFRLIKQCKDMGFECVDGYLTRNRKIVPVSTEVEFYRLLDLNWIDPRFRR